MSPATKDHSKFKVESRALSARFIRTTRRKGRKERKKNKIENKQKKNFSYYSPVAVIVPSVAYYWMVLEFFSSHKISISISDWYMKFND